MILKAFEPRYRMPDLILASMVWMLFAAVIGGDTVSAKEASRRPNFVFLLVDDLGWADLGCYGSTFYETPNIDRLAKRGVRFTQAYAAGSVCSPTRASIMTGRHPVRVDITDWIPGQNADRQPNAKFKHIDDRDSLALGEQTFAEMLKTVGYQTYFVGKWHLGDQGALPTDQGFDVNIAGYSKGSPPGGYYSPFKNLYLKDHEPNEYLTTRLTDEAIGLIDQRDTEQPFCLMFCYYNVHTPIQPYGVKIDHFREKATSFSVETPTTSERTATTRLRQDNPEYASMVAAVDDSVGRLMDSLKKNAVDENTVVVFFSDNGGLSTVGRMGPTCNLPLRSGKGWLYEGGIREPLIVALPDAMGSVCESPVFSTDFFPTIAELAGCQLEPNRVLDGESLVPLLKNSAGDNTEIGPERSFYWHYPHYHGSKWTPGAAIRHGDWKLIEFYETDTFELYDLAKDPGEIRDLAQKNPEVATRLRQELVDWQTELKAKMPQLR